MVFLVVLHIIYHSTALPFNKIRKHIKSKRKPFILNANFGSLYVMKLLRYHNLTIYYHGWRYVYNRDFFFQFLPRQDHDFRIFCLSRCLNFWRFFPSTTFLPKANSKRIVRNGGRGRGGVGYMGQKIFLEVVQCLG